MNRLLSRVVSQSILRMIARRLGGGGSPRIVREAMRALRRGLR